MKYILFLTLFLNVCHSKDSNHEYFCKNKKYIDLLVRASSVLEAKLYEEVERFDIGFDRQKEMAKAHTAFFKSNLSRFCRDGHDLKNELFSHVQYSLIRNENFLDSESKSRPLGSNPNLKCHEIEASPSHWENEIDRLKTEMHQTFHSQVSRFSKHESADKPFLPKLMKLDRVKSFKEGQDKELCEAVMMEMTNLYGQYKKID